MSYYKMVIQSVFQCDEVKHKKFNNNKNIFLCAPNGPSSQSSLFSNPLIIYTGLELVLKTLGLMLQLFILYKF